MGEVVQTTALLDEPVRRATKDSEGPTARNECTSSSPPTHSLASSIAFSTAAATALASSSFSFATSFAAVAAAAAVADSVRALLEDGTVARAVVVVLATAAAAAVAVAALVSDAESLEVVL